MSEHRASATLRITTAEVDLMFITSALGIDPTRERLKGSPKSRLHPSPANVFEESMWILESGLDSGDSLANHISILVERLKGRSVELNNIRDRISGIDLFCMFSSENGQGSMELPAELIKRIADLGIDVTIDLYPPTERGETKTNPSPSSSESEKASSDKSRGRLR
jgi:hypothetical protein